MHRCQSNDTAGGMGDLLRIESSYSDLPGVFWQDYALCATVANMPAHALRALDNAKKLGVERSDDKFVRMAAEKRLIPSSMTETYKSHEAWKAERVGDGVTFTSTLCGESFSISADAPIDVRDVTNGSCAAIVTGREYPTRDGKSTASLLVISQSASAAESLQDFTDRMMKNPRGLDLKAISGLPCPVAECLSFEVVSDKVYANAGGTHLLAVAFASEQPDYPGLIFEKPQALPKLTKQDVPQVMTPIYTLRRLDGKRYTLVMLDSNGDIFDHARVDFEALLKSLQIDTKLGGGEYLLSSGFCGAAGGELGWGGNRVEVAAGEHIFKQRDQLGMEEAVGGEQFPAVQAEGRAIEAGYGAACFLYEQHAGGGVPRVEVEFPIAVEAAARDIGEVERS
jgi:hypothetical protein